MNDDPVPVQYTDHGRALRLLGLVLLLVGLACAALGPAEMYCFYFFTEGGRFHFPGFGFGSFMFAFLAVQIMGYYVIAGVCIPLGYGHLRLRRWARTLTLAGLGFWSVVGLPLVMVFLGIWILAKDLSLAMVLAALPILALLYPVLPMVLSRGYRSRDVRLTFERSDPGPSWTDPMPVSLLASIMLYIFWILVLHVGILLRGAFPLFGHLVLEMPGVLLIDAAVLVLECLAWGTFRRSLWAWWAGVVGMGLATISTVWTLSTLSWQVVLEMMRFAPLEVDALDGVPIQGWHLAAFVGLPLLGTWVHVVRSRQAFRGLCSVERSEG